jgi:hypothetical protein
MTLHARWTAPLVSVLSFAAVATALSVPSAAHAVAPAKQAHLEPAQDDAHVSYHADVRLPAFRAVAAPGADLLYTVKPGDTLSGLSGKFCGNPADYPALAAANGIRDADLIFVGAMIRIACRAAVQAITGRSPAPAALDNAAPPARVTSMSGFLGCSGLEALWESAGGNSADAFMAAEIAMAESGGNQYAHSPTDDFGYWQINASNGSLATYDAYGNARSAIILSDNGTNWSPWTTYTSGAYAGRC